MLPRNTLLLEDLGDKYSMLENNLQSMITNKSLDEKPSNVLSGPELLDQNTLLKKSTIIETDSEHKRVSRALANNYRTQRDTL